MNNAVKICKRLQVQQLDTKVLQMLPQIIEILAAWS